ncbi:hypothetical protein MKSMC1_60530 [Mycobacterium kansasii]|nr:hypothetical protein MKSMC1_60530 [Mycobacterium kansasii]
MGVGIHVRGELFGTHGGQIDCCGALADAAFLIQNSDNFGHGGEGLSFFGRDYGLLQERLAKDYVADAASSSTTR